jgi:hypothetical protein
VGVASGGGSDCVDGILLLFILVDNVALTAVSTGLGQHQLKFTLAG